MRSPEAYSQAACLREDPELFFPQGKGHDFGFRTQVVVARSVCRSCPAQIRCLEDNLDVRDGIFAGTLPHQRKDLRARLGVSAMPLLDLPQDALALSRTRQGRRKRAARRRAESVTPLPEGER